MTEKPINGKAIYTPKGAALEYGRIGCNFYTGCPHECEYCYLKRGAPSKHLGGTEVRLKKCFKNEEDALRVFCEEVEKYKERCQRDGIFFSFTTDPMIKETRPLTLAAMSYCNVEGVPVWVLTKDATFLADRSFVSAVMCILRWNRGNIHFGFTLTGHNEMEPMASTNEERIMAMRAMKMLGFSTFASVEPVIDWVSANRMIIRSIDCCDHYKIGLRSGVKRDYYDREWLMAYVMGLVATIKANKRTVYLKESVRKAVKSAADYAEYPYELMMKDTVDMDGKPWGEGLGVEN